MFPLLLIPLAIVNIIVFLMSGVSLDAPVYTVTLPSLKDWTFTFSDALLAFSLLLLILEIGKAARPGAKYFTDHFLSLLIFVGAAAEFLFLPPFGNSTFLLLTLMAFVDFAGGILVRARRPKVVAAPVYQQPVPPAAPVQPERHASVAEPMPNPVVTPAPVPVAPNSGPVVLRPANDLEVIPPQSDAVAAAAADKRPDEPTVIIPQR